MKNILITGGSGFIGSTLINELFSLMMSKSSYCARIDNVNSGVREDSRYKFIQGDICDTNLVNFILKEYSIDTVIHMAAQTHVDRSFSNSLECTRDNILGTHSLLESCRRYGHIERFVHMSTDEVYGEVSHEELNPCTEYSILNPTSPYASTKAAAEFIVRSYGYSYKFPYIIIRANNAYGPNQYSDKLIPKFTLLLNSDKKIPIHGNGSSKRTFIHVKDMAIGIIIITLQGSLGSIYNIGSESEYTVDQISHKICDILGKKFEDLVEYVPDRNYNDKRYFIDYSKTMELGWKESISFEEGLRSTIEWYIKNQNKYEL